MEEDLFRGCGVEIKLASDDMFLKIKETLTRIGIASRKDKILYQSCHILHKRGRYAVVHFKELFILDGKPSTFEAEDIARRDVIANLICQWGLASLVDQNKESTDTTALSQIKILPHKEKADWDLVSKYTVGSKK